MRLDDRVGGGQRDRRGVPVSEANKDVVRRYQ
jgi:hypothetical protein